MFKKTMVVFSSLVLLAATNAYADKGNDKKIYKVTITNLTKGQPMTPAVIAVHSPHFNLFKLGEEASQGLKELSQDGITKTLVAELALKKSVVRTATGKGIILPGKSEPIEVEANNPYFKLSIASMLARTNDAIVAIKKLGLKLGIGQKYSVLANVYDAGAENNTEECAAVPAPPCNGHNTGTAGGEGFVRPHEGILGVADLEVSRDAFAAKAAKITVERIK